MKLLAAWGGLVLLSGGCYLHYPPLALIVPGAVLLAVVIGDELLTRSVRK